MNLIREQESDMIEIRRHIHANPELSNEEFKTTAFIKEKLTEYGIEVCEIGLKTGVVGLLRGGKTGKDSGNKRRHRCPPYGRADRTSLCVEG